MAIRGSFLSQRKAVPTSSFLLLCCPLAPPTGSTKLIPCRCLSWVAHGKLGIPVAETNTARVSWAATGHFTVSPVNQSSLGDLLLGEGSRTLAPGHLSAWNLKKEIIYKYSPSWTSLVAQTVKNLPAMRETQVRSLGQEGPLEKGMATHSSILAWEIPWTEEPGGLQSISSP